MNIGQTLEQNEVGLGGDEEIWKETVEPHVVHSNLNEQKKCNIHIKYLLNRIIKIIKMYKIYSEALIA